jgi:hypothetical protein
VELKHLASLSLDHCGRDTELPQQTRERQHDVDRQLRQVARGNDDAEEGQLARAENQLLTFGGERLRVPVSEERGWRRQDVALERASEPDGGEQWLRASEYVQGDLVPVWLTSAASRC